MKLFYKKLGQGPPVIILHGLFGSLDNWQSFGRQLSDLGFEVYLVDQRNHGHSPHSDVWDYRVMCEDVHELVIDNGLSGVTIIGHSMGGKTAMQFAVQYPHLLKKLIVVDITPYRSSIEPHKVIQALQAVHVDTIQSRKEAEEILKNKIPGDTATQQFLLKNLYWKDSESKKMAWRFNLPVIAENIIKVGEEIKIDSCKIPTLFIRGERSNYIGDEDKASLQKHFPDSTLETIPNAGHWVHAEQPGGFLKSVRKFLSG